MRNRNGVQGTASSLWNRCETGQSIGLMISMILLAFPFTVIGLAMTCVRSRVIFMAVPMQHYSEIVRIFIYL